MFRILFVLFLTVNLVWIFSQNSYTRQLVASNTISYASKIPLHSENQVKESPSPVSTPASSRVIQPSSTALLPSQKYVYQTYNNCGPATLSMLLDFYGINLTQQQIADSLRPYNNPQGYNDDKSVTLDELAQFAKKQNLVVYNRPNGDLEKIKKFVANGIPVITITWIEDKGGFGHYRIIKGFDDNKQQIIQDDSIFGQEQKVSYNEFMRLWEVFNYDYLVIAPSEKDEIVKTILADELDEKTAYTKALQKAKSAQTTYALFNQAINNYYLADYENAVKAYEQVQTMLPYRLLWYQIEPILAYQKLKKADKVFDLTDQIIQQGNPSFSEIYQVRGEVYLEKGEPESVKKEFAKALLYNKNYLPAQNALAHF